MYSKERTSWLSSIRRESIKMSKSYPDSATISVLTILVLVVISSMSLIVEARPSALTKKPPFNGSIFGKRSSTPGAPAGYEILGAADPSTEKHAVLPAQYQQLQQQQDAALLSAAISRCLAWKQQEWSTGKRDYLQMYSLSHFLRANTNMIFLTN